MDSRELVTAAPLCRDVELGWSEKAARFSEMHNGKVNVETFCIKAKAEI